MNPIAERIIDNGVCPSEINQHNASVIMRWVRDTDSHHAPADCTGKKDCIHAPTHKHIVWAATLVSEAPHICTCGEHGDDDPSTAADIIRGFRDEFSKDNKRPPKVKR